MIPYIMEVILYTSIIYMILLYDTLHYDQPKKGAYQPRRTVNFLKSRAIYGYMEIFRGKIVQTC
jgi:hypothetical protein